MIDKQLLSSDFRDEPTFDAPQVTWQPTSDNGSEYYGIITVGAIVGIAAGAFSGIPLLGLFTGIGAGTVGAICFAASRQLIGLFNND